MNSDSLKHDSYNTLGSYLVQGSMFLPYPGDTSNSLFYYLMIDEEDFQPSYLKYSVVDLSLDSGLGGIVDGKKNIQIIDVRIGEGLTAIKHANGRDWWIIARKVSSFPFTDRFIYALLTPNGIELSGESVPEFTGTYGGNLTGNRKGNLLAWVSASAYSHTMPTLALYNFDRCSGNISIIDTILARSPSDQLISACFAPDSNILYVSTDRNFSLYQYSWPLNNLKDSLIFRIKGPGLSTYGNRGGNLVMGADNKIYMSMRRQSLSNSLDGFAEFLAVITKPDLSGIGCYFDTFGVFMNGRENTTYSLPNFPNYDLGALLGSPCDTLSPVDTTQTSIPVFPQGTTTWSVIPTISDGLFTIQGAANGTLMVYDLYGREVFRKPLTNSTSFDPSTYPPGLYWVTVQKDDGTWYPARKIIRK